MYYRIACLFLLICASTVEAQNFSPALDKLDAQLKLWVAERGLLDHDRSPSVSAVSDNYPVDVLFKTTGGNISELAIKHHVQVRSVIGSICTGSLPIGEVLSFASEPNIIRIESSPKLHLLTDTAKRLIGADKVQMGQLPGGLPFSGKGVIVGVCDAGIDFAHPDFRNKDDSTRTRFLSIWDQSIKSGTKPQPYNYGSVWSKAEIDAALPNPNSLTTRDVDGHGTLVTGIAAGLRGMAPDADIIAVHDDLHWNSDTTIYLDGSKMLDGVKYIADQASMLGRPAVVNLSIGYTTGTPHDGTGLFCEGLDQLVAMHTGFIVVVGAGNDALSGIHFGGLALGTDSVWTYAHGIRGASMYAVFNTQNEDSTFISVIMDSVAMSPYDSVWGQTAMYQSPWISLKEIRNAAKGQTYNGGNSNQSLTATIKLFAALFDSTRTELHIDMTQHGGTNYNRNEIFRVNFKGVGVFQAWSDTYSLPLEDIVLDNIPGIYKDPQFRANDNVSGINVIATGKNVLAVGACVNRVGYIDSTGDTLQGPNFGGYPSGSYAFFSSQGPTTDGRVKPEISAPGVNIATSRSRSATFSPTEIIDSLTVMESGTSMASPVAAGAIALYLERSPKASFAEIKSAIVDHADNDSLTSQYGAAPNQYFGYGRLNIFSAMNFTSSAVEIPISSSLATIQPNPASKQIVVSLAEQAVGGQLTIIDVTGRSLFPRLVANRTQTIDISDWPKGVYFLHLSMESQSSAYKLIVK